MKPENLSTNQNRSQSKSHSQLSMPFARDSKELRNRGVHPANRPPRGAGAASVASPLVSIALQGDLGVGRGVIGTELLVASVPAGAG